MSSLIQRSFSGGEIAPALYARVDTSKYANGVRTLRNFLLMRHGGASNRPGTEFICEVKDSTKTVRLIPFVFNTSQTYMLEFGDQYMRVLKSGVPIRNAAQNISGISNANPGVLTYSGADNYANGDHVYISGITSSSGLGNYLNGRTLKVAGVNTGANTFQLNYLDGSAVNTSSWGSYSAGGGTIAEIYEIATPYLEADLADLKFVQSADVITIVHPTYAPRQIARTADDNWTLTTVTFAPEITAPGSVINSGAAGSATEWVVTQLTRSET